MYLVSRTLHTGNFVTVPYTSNQNSTPSCTSNQNSTPSVMYLNISHIQVHNKSYVPRKANTTYNFGQMGVPNNMVFELCMHQSTRVQQDTFFCSNGEIVFEQILSKSPCPNKAATLTGNCVRSASGCVIRGTKQVMTKCGTLFSLILRETCFMLQSAINCKFQWSFAAQNMHVSLIARGKECIVFFLRETCPMLYTVLNCQFQWSFVPQKTSQVACQVYAVRVLLQHLKLSVIVLKLSVLSSTARQSQWSFLARNLSACQLLTRSALSFFQRETCSMHYFIRNILPILLVVLGGTKQANQPAVGSMQYVRQQEMIFETSSQSASASRPV